MNNINKNRYKIKIRFKLLFLTLVFSIIPVLLLLYFTQKNIYNYLIRNSREFNFKSLQQFTNNLNFMIEKTKRELENIKNSEINKELGDFKIKDRVNEIIFYEALNNKLREYIFSREIGDLIIIDFTKTSLLKNNYSIDIYSKNSDYLVNIDEFKKEDFFTNLDRWDGNNYILAKIKRSSIVGDNIEGKLLLINFVIENKEIKKVFILILNEEFIKESLKFINDFDYSKIIIVDKYNSLIDIKYYNEKDQIFNRIYKKISANFYTNENILELPEIKRLTYYINKQIENNEFASSNYYSIINYEKQKFMVLIYYNWEQSLTYYTFLPLSIVLKSVRRTILTIIFIAAILFIIVLISSVVSSKLIANPIETRATLIQDENIYFMNIAHELKTPLTVISNYIDKYIKEYGENKDIEIIKNNIESLKKDMIDFLDFGKIERGQPFYDHQQLINLSETIKNKIVLFSVNANQRNIVFNKKLEDNVYVKIDPFALDRILNNLLDNAIKYNKENGIVNITLETKGDKVILTISDTGIGISEKKLKNLFNPFTQVMDGSKNSGVGLGLFIIKKIIDEVKGEISIESKLNQGTKFTIKFPLAKKDSSSLVNKENKNVQKFSNDLTILIVEDNEDLLNYLSISLQEYFNIKTANNPLTALEELKNIKPDLIISDVMMPNMNGFEFFDILSSKSEFKDIPFIFLSAIGSTQYKIRGLESGAIDYIVKPFKIEELLAKINSLIKFKKLKDMLYERDKYATIGMLVAGISHEILNPLAGIYAPLENIEKFLNKEEPPDKEKIKLFIENIWVNVKRIDSIIKNLKILFYNDGASLEKKDINIEEICNSVLELFHNKIKNRIEIVKNIEKDITVKANYAALTQIFINLISNAIDAILENGTITLECYKENSNSVINIIDTGCGIKEEDFKNIFTPFWTTKEVGKGTGLGLYIVKDIINKFNWELKVSSTVGKGSKFSIIIPVN